MLLSTNGVRRNQSARFWRDICNVIVEVDCKIDGQTFSGSIECTSLGNLPAFIVSMQACHIERTARHIGDAMDAPVLLIYEAKGANVFDSRGEQFVYGHGQFVLVDTAIPFRARIGTSARQLVMPIDRQALALRLGDYRRYLNIAVSGQRPLGLMAISMLSALRAKVRELDPVASMKLEGQLLDLVALALSHELDLHPAPVTRQGPLVRLNAAIDAAILDPRQEASDVAAKAGMSLGEANLLLRRDRNTLPAVLRDRRLDRSRERLIKGIPDRETLSRIAMDAGYGDVIQFRKDYRERFGEDLD